MREDGSPGTVQVQKPWRSGGYTRTGYPLCFAMLPLALLLAVLAAPISRVLRGRCKV